MSYYKAVVEYQPHTMEDWVWIVEYYETGARIHSYKAGGGTITTDPGTDFRSYAPTFKLPPGWGDALRAVLNNNTPATEDLTAISKMLEHERSRVDKLLDALMVIARR